MKTEVLQGTNEVTVDGMSCIQRAGRVWMTDAVAAEYVGRTAAGYRCWVHSNRITRIRHGRWALSPKDEIDKVSGCLEGG